MPSNVQSRIPTVSPTIISLFPSSSPNENYCDISAILGQTFYFPALNYCWRLQVFDGGTLKADTNDPSCDKISRFTSGTGPFSSFEFTSSSNKVTYSKVAYGGTIKFEPDSVSAPELEVIDIDEKAFTYDFVLKIPSCPPVCHFLSFSERTFQFSLVGLCWQVNFGVNFGVNGGLFADFNTKNPCDGSQFQVLNQYSDFDSFQDSTGYVSFAESNISVSDSPVSGRIQIVRDQTVDFFQWLSFRVGMKTLESSTLCYLYLLVNP